MITGRDGMSLDIPAASAEDGLRLGRIRSVIRELFAIYDVMDVAFVEGLATVDGVEVYHIAATGMSIEEQPS